jgi:hypothetical protein
MQNAADHAPIVDTPGTWRAGLPFCGYRQDRTVAQAARPIAKCGVTRATINQG